MDPRSPDPVAYACAVKRTFPAIPSAEALAIAVHVCRGGRGRTSSTARGQWLARAALTRAVTNHVRHSHTVYDRLLHLHGDRWLARAQVRDVVDGVLRAWRDIRSAAHPACTRCWQTNRRHLRTLECDAELAARAASVETIVAA